MRKVKMKKQVGKPRMNWIMRGKILDRVNRQKGEEKHTDNLK